MVVRDSATTTTVHSSHGDTLVPPETNLVDRLRFWSRVQPHATAFCLDDGERELERLSYQELDLRAQAIAVQLQRGQLAGQAVLLAFPPGLEFVAALYGCFYANVVAVPVYPPRPGRIDQRLESIAQDCAAECVLTVSSLANDWENRCQLLDRLRGVRPLATERWRESGSLPELPGPRADDQTAIIQYTSGSTGDPRGVMLSHRNLMHNSWLIARTFDVGVTGVGLSWCPTYHDMGLVGGVLKPAYIGRPSILMPPLAFLQKPIRWLRAIDRHGVTVSGGPNFAYDLCVEKIEPEQCAGLDLSRWEIAYNGAEPIRAETLESFAEKFAPYGFQAENFLSCYGLAESTLLVTGGNKSESPRVGYFDRRELSAQRAKRSDARQPDAIKVTGSGIARTGIQVQIVEPTERIPLPEGQVGEIWVRSTSVGQGYWRKLEETEATFRARIPSDASTTYLRTGDLGFLLDGELYVTGRMKELIILRGMNRYPDDIERTVTSEVCGTLVRGVVAFGCEFDGVEQLVLVCELARTHVDQTQAVIQEIRKQIMRCHELIPEEILLVRRGSIPKTSSGKLQRLKCRQAYLDENLPITSRWKRNRTRQVGLVHQAGHGAVEAANQCRIDRDDLEFRGMDPVVLQALCRVLVDLARDPVDVLDWNTKFEDLGLDSLERVGVLAGLERELRVKLPAQYFAGLETVGEILLAVQGMRGDLALPHGLWSGSETTEDSVSNWESFTEFVQLKSSFRQLKEDDLPNPYFCVSEGIASSRRVVDGREVIDFSNYNYLAMSGDPAVNAAAKAAIDQYGTSASASRIVAGELPVHRQLEDKLAEFLGTEASLVFVSGHATNETTIGHLFDQRDLILHDELVHNSVLQGAQLSGAQRRCFAHNDWQAAERVLRDMRNEVRRVLVVIEGVYSMDGDVPDLPRFIELKERHQALLMVDEAHSLGTMGATGRGLAEHFGIAPKSVDLWMGTLSKALGSCGGYIAGSRGLVEYLKYTAPGFVFSVGMAPPAAAAALTALEVLESQPERVRRCQANASFFLRTARERNFDTGSSEKTPVIPIILGNSRRCLLIAHQMFRCGVNVRPILFPAVAESAARLRFFVTASHDVQQLEKTIEVLSEALSRGEQVEDQS